MGAVKSRSSPLSGIAVADSTREGMLDAVNADEGGSGRSVCLVFVVMESSAANRVEEKNEGEPCGDASREADGEEKKA